MKKIVLLFGLCVALFADDIVVFNNEYTVLTLQHKVKKLIVGNKDMINVSVLDSTQSSNKVLKIFGKKSGNTSILIVYADNSLQNYHVYVNQNLGFIQKMVNMIEPNLKISKVGDGSTVISGEFKDPHDKKRIYALLKNGGIDLNKLMDLTQTKKVNKMVRTKLYLVEVNNQRAKDLGGVTGLSFFDKYTKVTANPSAINGATFSGFLLDNTGSFISQTGSSIIGTLNFLEQKGIAKILDDTVLMTTEDENASFRVGGEVYIPTGLTQNVGALPTIQLSEREYGLRLTLTSHFMEKDGFMHIDVAVKDSEFDTNKEHYVQLGEFTFVPSFVSKNMQTNVVVKSGQVIALGGRLHTEKTKQEEKVPFLGDIPWIGELFKHNVAGSKENDLLFFLVPEIVDANEKVDDTHFYREFKNSSKQMHESILDMNISHTTPLAVVNDPKEQINHEENNVSCVDDGMIIEVEQEGSETPDSNVSEEISVDQTPHVDKDLELKENNESMEEKTFDEQEELSGAENSEEPIVDEKFQVATGKIFLRQSPIDGRRILVWKEGHKFTTNEEKNIDGSVWLRVNEDCFSRCTKTETDLWIAKKFVEKI